MTVRPGRLPPRSPYSLIQEDLFPDEFAILVACMMLNCTSRKQVEKVLPSFLKRWPSAQDVAEADQVEMALAIKTLGFSTRRSVGLVKMAAAYVKKDWKHARELPGIGAYAGASWEIFCQGTLPIEAPRDHALTQYFHWAVKQGE